MPPLTRILQYHRERFPDELFTQLIKVPALNDESVPFGVAKFLEWRMNPWQWMIEQVYTVDESDGQVKPFPAFKYLRLLVELYFQRKIIVVPKTRRMMLTHTFGDGVLPHQLLFKDYSDNIFVSMSEKKARKVFRKRCKFTLDNLDLRFPYPVNYENPNKSPMQINVDSAINHTNGAELAAVPSGSDKCRGDTLSNAIYDELAFQTYVEENLKALKPALEGKDCRAALISSPSPGTEFEKLCVIKEGSDFEVLMEGLSISYNDLNHLIIKVNYKAHPWKRSKEWYYKERYGTTPDGVLIPGAIGVDTHTWLQEYEGSFAFPAGEPAIVEYSEEMHCGGYRNLRVGTMIGTRTMFLSFDFGSRFPCMTISFIDSIGRAVIENGVMVQDMQLMPFLQFCLEFLDKRYPGWESNFEIYTDPVGTKGNKEGTSDPATEIVEKFFKKRVKNRGRTCHVLDGVRAINEKLRVKTGDTMGVVVNAAGGLHINEVGKEEWGFLGKVFIHGYSFRQEKTAVARGGKSTTLDIVKHWLYGHPMDTIRYFIQNEFPSRKVVLDNHEKKQSNSKKKKPISLRR